MASVRLLALFVIALDIAFLSLLGTAEDIKIVEGLKSSFPSPTSGLTIGFYNASCPSLEQIVESRIKSFFEEDITEAAALLHIFFHDCFVTGCDASVLLASSSRGPAEYDYTPDLALRKKAFNIIDNIKQELEATCPETVSCADILALAARDSVRLTGGPSISMPTGRRDGMEAANEADTSDSLPPPTFNVNQSLVLFSLHGMDTVDLVALSGAHTIGVTHCKAITRLFSSSGVLNDTTLDPSLVGALLAVCPSTNFTGVTVGMDAITPNVFDNKYYVNLEDNKALFISDQTMLEEQTTKTLVEEYANDEELFLTAFAKSFVKLGSLGVLIDDNEGEIRLNCSVINSNSTSTVAISMV